VVDIVSEPEAASHKGSWQLKVIGQRLEEERTVVVCALRYLIHTRK
jgi:hypothetical protein